MAKGKIINDPVYGFLHFPEPELMQIIEHPWFQRLRNIRQMGMAHTVYPGAVHTRFHHSLGASYLMGKALDVLKAKGVDFSERECTSARMAILLHDVGHGPFSHALEHTLVDSVNHEQVSKLIMSQLNTEMSGMLEESIAIFNHTYSKKYLHQLVSSQLDVDRMDYLNRDSFFTGVSEGVISYDRILQMLAVHDDELMVEIKAVHSVEKFIIARRLMYWQVYLHKTVLGAEHLLINILKRAKYLAQNGEKLFATPALSFFLEKHISMQNFEEDLDCLSLFCQLDDTDILCSIKVWRNHKDRILSTLCKMLTDRHLYKVVISSSPLVPLAEAKEYEIMQKFSFTKEEIAYFVFSGSTFNSTYDIEDEQIKILLKDGSVLDISEVENPLVTQALAKPVHKNFVCYLPSEAEQLLSVS